MDGFKSSILSGIEDDGLYLNSELFYIKIIYETKIDRIIESYAMFDM